MSETCPKCGGVGKVFRTTAAGTIVVACPECGKRDADWEARCRELETALAASQAEVKRLREKPTCPSCERAFAKLQAQLAEARKDVEQLKTVCNEFVSSIVCENAGTTSMFAYYWTEDWNKLKEKARAAIDAARKDKDHEEA